jgi:hypothetical protein
MEPGHYLPTAPVFVDMHNPAYDEDRSTNYRRHLTMMICGVGAASLFLLIIPIIALLILKCRQRQARKAFFTYTQLVGKGSADEPAPEDKAVVA